MELLAVIHGLSQLKTKAQVRIHSDSKYVIDGIRKGWAKKWRAQGWMRNAKESAVNADLWSVLLTLVEQHVVEWIWVKGHNGHLQNERCDGLATWAMKQKDLKVDEGYRTKAS